jgi:hypothetical protein
MKQPTYCDYQLNVGVCPVTVKFVGGEQLEYTGTGCIVLRKPFAVDNKCHSELAICRPSAAIMRELAVNPDYWRVVDHAGQVHIVPKTQIKEIICGEAEPHWEDAAGILGCEFYMIQQDFSWVPLVNVALITDFVKFGDVHVPEVPAKRWWMFW